jgi:heme/copper-type cytochrome/quinol oxidase subunit 3
MTAQRTLDVGHLPAYNISSRAPLWWGQFFLTLIEGSMFGILIAMYFYIRSRMDVWPPPGIQLPRIWLPSACLVLLILSCIGSYLASDAAKKDNRSGMIFGLSLNLVLALAAVTLRVVDWSSWNFKWTSTGYGSVVWGIVFLHTLDVGADLAFTFVLLLIVASGRHGPRHRLGVHVDSVVWYFLVAAWIPLYGTVYWGPYLVGAPK